MVAQGPVDDDDENEPCKVWTTEMLTNDGDISMSMMNEQESMSKDDKKILYARVVHSNHSIQYHMHQIIEQQKVVDEYKSMMMEGMDLTNHNWSVMIGNGQSISCTHKGKLDVICKHKDESMARETWDVKIVPQLNHDLFSFTKAMKEGWQMNGRWKEGGLVIELFKTTRASMKFDRMIPSGSSWLMRIKVQRVLDHAHSAMEPGKTISMSKLHQITGHTGEHLLRPTANFMRIKLTGKLAPCEVCAQAKIRQMNISKNKMKKLPTRPGYRVFMDICSFKQVSRGGNRHWLIVVDEFSDCTHSLFLNRKSDQIKIIPMWIKGLSKQYGIEIKRIRLLMTKVERRNRSKLIYVR